MPLIDLNSNRRFILFVKPNSFKSVIIFMLPFSCLSSYSVARKIKEKQINTYMKSNFFKVSMCFYPLSSWLLSSCSGKRKWEHEKYTSKIGFTVHLKAKPLIDFILFKTNKKFFPNHLYQPQTTWSEVKLPEKQTNNLHMKLSLKEESIYKACYKKDTFSFLLIIVFANEEIF